MCTAQPASSFVPCSCRELQVACKRSALHERCVSLSYFPTLLTVVTHHGARACCSHGCRGQCNCPLCDDHAKVGDQRQYSIMRPSVQSPTPFDGVCSRPICNTPKLSLYCLLHTLRALQGSRQEKRCFSRPTLQSGEKVYRVVLQTFKQILVESLVFFTRSCMSRFYQAQAIALSAYGMCQTERPCRPGWTSFLMSTAPTKCLRFDVMQAHATLYLILLTNLNLGLHCQYTRACH